MAAALIGLVLVAYVPGALIFSDTLATRPLLRCLGPDVRITGLRLLEFGKSFRIIDQFNILNLICRIVGYYNFYGIQYPENSCCF